MANPDADVRSRKVDAAFCTLPPDIAFRSGFATELFLQISVILEGFLLHSQFIYLKRNLSVSSDRMANEYLVQKNMEEAVVD